MKNPVQAGVTTRTGNTYRAGGTWKVHDDMTQTEFIAYLETLADLIRNKAKTPEEAAEILEELAKKLK